MTLDTSARIAAASELLDAIASRLKAHGGMHVEPRKYDANPYPEIPKAKGIEIALTEPATIALSLRRVEMWVDASDGIQMGRGDHVDPNWRRGDHLPEHHVGSVPRLTYDEESASWTLESGGEAAAAFVQRTIELFRD